MNLTQKLSVQVMMIKSAAKKNKDKELLNLLKRVYDEGFKDGSGFDGEMDANYICGNCGMELNQTIQARYCYHCGAELDFSEVE